MTLYTFKDLTEIDQLNTLRRNGTFLAERKDTHFRYVLYQLDAFYVEFTYNVTGIDQQKMQIFAGTGPLAPYLSLITLPENF